MFLFCYGRAAENQFTNDLLFILTLIQSRGGLHSKGGHTALPKNNRLGWKWITLTNTQASYNTEFNYGSKVFLNERPGIAIGNFKNWLTQPFTKL